MAVRISSVVCCMKEPTKYERIKRVNCNYTVDLFIYLFPYPCDKMEENEMGGACGTYGGRERCEQGFDGET